MLPFNLIMWYSLQRRHAPKLSHFHFSPLNVTLIFFYLYSYWKEGWKLWPLTNEEQEKYGPTLTVRYMSEDEDESEGEGWRHMELPWRSNELTQFFRTLHDRLKLKCLCNEKMDPLFPFGLGTLLCRYYFYQ
jgi:hypothetical protein